MDDDHNGAVEHDENDQLSEDDIAQIHDDEGRAEDYYASDDDEMPGSSNASAMDDEAVDDSCTSLQAHSQDCFSIAIVPSREAGSREPSFLATGGEDDVAFIFNPRTSEAIMKIEHQDSVVIVAFNASHSLLATGDMSGKIIVTDVATLTTRAEVNDCNDLEWMTWHPKSDIIFAGDKDGMIWMWLIGPRGVVQSKVFTSTGAACSVGQILSDGMRLAAGYADGSFRLWKLKEQTAAQLNFNSAVTAVQHHSKDPVAIVGTQRGFVYVISTSQRDNLRRVSEIPPLNDTQAFDDEDEVDQCVECLSFAPNQPWFVVGRNDGSVCVFETNSSTPRSIFRSPMNQAISRSLWVQHDNIPLLVVGSVDGYIRAFDSRDGSLFKQIGNGGDAVLDMLEISSNPLQLMTAGTGGFVRMATYHLYRNTTLGQALKKTLDDMEHDQLITNQLSMKVMAAFDKSFNKNLQQKARNKVTFKAEKLKSYRFCDNVWTFLMEKVDFREAVEGGSVLRVKIVACDGSAKTTL